MEQYIYEKITDHFVMLRYLTNGFTEDKGAVIEIMEDFDRIIPYIEKFGTEEEKAILLYVIRTAKELILEILPYSFRYSLKRRLFKGNIHAGKILRANCFFDAVHNICELFTTDNWKQNSYVESYIKPFQAQYGASYFTEILSYF